MSSAFARPLVWLTGIGLLALALRLFQIGDESLWIDEWLSLDGAKHIDDLNRHRPLYYLVLRVCLWFGSSDVWVRLPAAIFGVVAILLLFLVARQLAQTSVALVACLIMTVATPEIDHAQEARMYTMGSALTLASICLLLQWVQWRKLWMLGLHLALTYSAFLTTPTTIFGLLLAGTMAGLVLLWRGQTLATIKTVTGYALLIAGWWSLKRYARLALASGSLDWIPRPSQSALLSVHSSLLTNGLGATREFEPSQTFEWSVSLLALLLVSIAVIANMRGDFNARRAAIIAAWFYGVVLGMYAVSILKTPVWCLRYLHSTAPALYLLLAVGLVSLARWRPTAAWAAGIALAGSISLATVDYYRLKLREDWRGVAAVVAAGALPSDLVVVIGPAELFARYYRGAAAVQGVWPHLEKMPEYSDAVVADFFARFRPHAGRTWIVVREEPRVERVAFLERLNRFLSDHHASPRVRSFHTFQGRLTLLDFIPAANTAEAKAASPLTSHRPRPEEPAGGIQISLHHSPPQRFELPALSANPYSRNLATCLNCS